jgi:metal-sulfur cluster biosynthetic enzyme
MIDEAAIEAALRTVHDPCSVAAGRPQSVVDMGLVTGWHLDADGVLDVTFAVTFAGCTMAPHFMAAAEAELAKLPGVSAVRTKVDTQFVWTPERMRNPARALVGEPQAWRRRAG